MRHPYTFTSLLRKKGIVPVYLLGVFYTFHYAVPTYINSTFLSNFIGESGVGFVYSAASFITLLGVLSITKVVERVGNYKTVLSLIILEALALFGLVVSSFIPLLLFAFIIHFMLTTIVLFNVDIFLESFSDDEETGGIRGIYLVFLSFAWMLAPAFAGYILADGAFRGVYLAALILLLPSLFILTTQLRHFKDKAYHHLNFFKTIRKVWANNDIRSIYLANLVLRMFFAMMVVYVPIYLNKHIGLDFETLGIIFTVMLAAYVLLEYPLGKIADTLYGEKEILTLGFVIVAVSAALLSFTTSTSLFVWAGILFLSRVGAAMVEVMSESYFFKKIDGEDTDILSIFRTTGPTGYMIAPLLGSVYLLFFNMQSIFLAVGIFTLSGILFAADINDTL